MAKDWKRRVKICRKVKSLKSLMRNKARASQKRKDLIEIIKWKANPK